MLFHEFAGKLSAVIRGGCSTDRFAKTLFSSIVIEDGQDILDEYSTSSFKGFYNGNTSISRIANKINTYTEPMEFSAYIHSFPDSVVENLCSVFSDQIPDINSENAGDKLAELFVSIITNAAGAKKKIVLQSIPKEKNQTPIIMDPETAIAPDLAEYKDGIFYLEGLLQDGPKDSNPFRPYLEAATSYYSTKKTLLYAEKPHPFYELYVCNNIRYRKFRITGTRDPKTEKIISDVTISKLEAESKYIIIQGIGGIGKSMLLTHLFLSSSKETASTGMIPILLSLKDYRDTTTGIVDFIWKSANEFDPKILQKDILDSLQKKSLVLLLDGLDEIQSSVREAFNTDLEAFIKSYPGNMVIITSRPVNSFISYTKFSVFEIQELTKKQALELVSKLDFWDVSAKTNFLDALDRYLYHSHYQFASNPLLLTIMLMTYSSFGEVPAKMHVFYSKAYETMARLHDASKGSFKRPLHTKLTPEEFAKLFAEFCARTYKDEILEFDSRLFTSYMAKVLRSTYAEACGVLPQDFLLDLTDNLCIMYREGEKYYFIHRSFQEYFAAVHFASGYDARLSKVGNFFEKMQHRSYTDRTFDMLYDMIPEKIERYIFLPFLENLLSECAAAGKDEEYWEFLEQQYPVLYYEEGRTGETYFNEAQSFLYKTIISEMELETASNVDDYGWPPQIYDLPTQDWYDVYREFLEHDAFDVYPDPDAISAEVLEDTILVTGDELPYRYTDYFGEQEPVGKTIEIEIYQLRKTPAKYAELRRAMELAEFPLMQEYQNVKKYFAELKLRSDKEDESDDLFDD